MVRLTGACCGLLAFSIAIARGLSVQNAATTILGRAIFAMVLFFALGSILGWVAQRVVQEHVSLKEEEELAPYREVEESADSSAAEASETSGNSLTPQDAKPIAT